MLHCEEGHVRGTLGPSQQCQAINPIHPGVGEGRLSPIPGHLVVEKGGWHPRHLCLPKPTHTDRYLHFRSHHPTHVRRGLVRCLYDRARSITTSLDSLKREEGHLASVLKCNGYPSAFILTSSTPPTQPVEDTRGEQPEARRATRGKDRPPLVVLPYVSGVSEDIRCVCGRYNLRVVFRSGRTLCSMLTRVKDTLPLEKHSNVVNQIPCRGCSKVYIGIPSGGWRQGSRNIRRH